MLETEEEFRDARIRLRNLAAKEDALRVRGNDWTRPYAQRLLDLDRADILQVDQYHLSKQLQQYINRQRAEYDG